MPHHDDRHGIPPHIQSVHLIAVCGTAMGALAAMLQEMGLGVTGSDRNVYPPMSTFLEQRGIRIMEGFAPEHLAHRPDLVVVGNAVSRDNPEVEAMGRLGLTYCSMPEALNHFAAAGKETLLVAGTHGKTTTSSLLAWLLYAADLDPTLCIGGILNNFNSNYRLGRGPYFVVEGDEYDTAYFDKGPKFLHYRPGRGVLTRSNSTMPTSSGPGACEIRFPVFSWSALRRRASWSPGTTMRISRPCCPKLYAGVERYGRRQGPTGALGRSTARPGARFECWRRGYAFRAVSTAMIGEHNLLNTLAAIGCGRAWASRPERIMKALGALSRGQAPPGGPGRRRGIVVIDDFAHHPTAVRETLRAVKTFYGSRRLIAVFEPRTNTSMRDVFQNHYAACFRSSRSGLHPPATAAAKDSRRSALFLAPVGGRPEAAGDATPTISPIRRPFSIFCGANPGQGDVILIMSNGGFDNIHARLLDRLADTA